MLDQILKGSETEPGSCLRTPANEAICKRGKRVDGAVIFSMKRFGGLFFLTKFLQLRAGFTIGLVEKWKEELEQNTEKTSFSQASLECNVYHRKHTAVIYQLFGLLAHYYPFFFFFWCTLPLGKGPFLGYNNRQMSRKEKILGRQSGERRMNEGPS